MHRGWKKTLLSYLDDQAVNILKSGEGSEGESQKRRRNVIFKGHRGVFLSLSKESGTNTGRKRVRKRGKKKSGGESP